MKRYIDLRGQGTACKFAWWDTINIVFEEHSGSMAWDSWEEFAEDYEGTQIERYRKLVPNRER